MTQPQSASPPVPGTEGMHAAYRATRRFGSLDGLRFVCIMGVMWHHGPIWSGMADWTLATRGFLGVDFFFVLSGYLITTLLLRETAAKGRFSLSGFYWRRALRILPVYLLVVTAVTVYYVAIKGQIHYLELAPFYYLFLANFLVADIPLLSPMWSLSVEEQFYMIWPLLMLMVPRRALLPLLGVLIALNLVAVLGGLRVFGIVPFEIGPLRFAMFTATYAPLLMGAGLAVLLHAPRSFAWVARPLGGHLSPAFAFVGLGVLLGVLPHDVTGWPNLAIHLTMTVCLASIVLREDHVLRPVFAARPIARVGEISYGIYLYHLIALHVTTVALDAAGLTGGIPGGLMVLAGYTLVSIAISEVSFRLYERRFLDLRHRVPGRVSAKAAS